MTKIFVVVLSLFSIAVASATVAMVAQQANWRDTALKYQEHAQLTDTNLRHAHAAAAAQLATARDEVRQHLEKIADIETQLQAARNDGAQLKAEFAQAASEKSSAEAMNRGLLAQLQTTDATRAEYRKQRDDLEKRNIDLERRNIDLNDRVNELTANVDVLLEQKRQYEQQIAILRSENDKLSAATGRPPARVGLEEPAGAAMAGVNAVNPVAVRTIRSKVLDVSGELVTIGVGSAAGVKKDMVFVIHRKGEYIGDLKITLVQPDQSAGRLTLSSKGPTAGDDVTDQGSMTGR
jgi:predicted  nucleic acid-binding Zn-ribbon protein